MEERNQFDNEPLNSNNANPKETEEIINEPILDNLQNNDFVQENEPAENEPINNQTVSGFENDIQSTKDNDAEIDLDPEIVIDSSNGVNSEDVNGYQNSVQANPDIVDFHNGPLEPIAPIMPQITKSEYHPIEPSASNKGIKVFAVIVSLMVIISACVTGGYFLGKGSNSLSSNITVDLAKKPTADNAMTTSQIYKAVNPSIVGIYVYNTKGIASTASGVVYSSDGYIVTNDHIYDDVASPKFKVYTSDEKMYSAEYVAGDTRSDLAILKIKNVSNLKPADFGNSDEAVVGESVIAIGRPNGATNTSTASEGIISAVSARVSTTSSYTSRLIQTDSAINPGSSGGALCNIYGQVIGITSAKLVGSEYEGVGYAIPTTTVKKIAEPLIKYKTVKGRAKLGISYLGLDELTAELSDLPCGLRVAEIDKSSDLYGKSVEVNDIITHVGGTKITNSNIILDVIENSSPGDMLNLKVYSVSKKKYFDVTVKLLEDVGSSSYSTQSDTNNNSSNSKDDSQQYNASEFSFPNGE